MYERYCVDPARRCFGMSSTDSSGSAFQDHRLCICGERNGRIRTNEYEQPSLQQADCLAVRFVSETESSDARGLKCEAEDNFSTAFYSGAKTCLLKQ